ncbi:MAG: zf-HC2 domain-containing protein [Acidobacteriota bacterium]
MHHDDDTTPHQHWRELLPWHANESLADDERQQVEEHLEGCQECRDELDELVSLQSVVAESPAGPAATEEGFQDLLASVGVVQPTRSRRARWPLLVMAGQAAAIVVLGVLLMQSQGGGSSTDAPPASFRTLSDAPEGGGLPKDEVMVRVVFSETATERAIRDLLLELDAEIAAGPTIRGAYTLKSASDRDGVLAGLRASDVVRFAEPVTTGE